MFRWILAAIFCLALTSNLVESSVLGEDRSEVFAKARINLPAFDRALDLRVVDIGRMQIINSSAMSRPGLSCLHQDRGLRILGYGDFAWSEATQQWVAFRGAKLVHLDQHNLETAVTVPTSELRRILEEQGRVVVHFDETRCVAVQTAEGHLAIFQVIKRNQGTLDLDVYRLTTADALRVEQANDRVAGASWGPVIDGLQAGLAFRSPGPKDNWQRTVGESVPVKVFVRNVGDQPRNFSWQQFRDKNDQRTPAPRLPLLVSWNPRLVDSSQTPVPVSPLQNSGIEVPQKALILQPREPVLIGVASIVLSSKIDVGFGLMPPGQAGVAVDLGEHRLSVEVDTGLISQPKLQTGSLSLRVTSGDPKEVEVLGQFVAIAEDQARQDDVGWQSETSAYRSALADAEVEYLTLPCVVRDAETKQPVAGATARVEIAALGNQSFQTLCAYNLVTDAEGRFAMRIPQKLLSGFKDGFRADYRIHVTREGYSELFDSQSHSNLVELGFVDADGIVLKQGTAPGAGDARAVSRIQQLALQPARTLSGRLFSKDGQPLHKVSIYCNNMMGLHVTTGFPKTDEEGRFSFNVPSKQKVKLEFRTAEFGRNYTVVKPDQTDLGDIRAVEGVRVRGQVLDAAGKPLASVRVTTPSFPDESAQPNFIYTTDANGWFATDALAPGEYQAVVGSMKSSDSGDAALIGPPVDLYLPILFRVKSGEPIADLIQRPASATRLNFTLTSSVPPVSEGELPHVLDPLFWRLTQEKAQREREKQMPDQAPQPFFQGNAEEQQKIALGWISHFAGIPSVTVKGQLPDQAWTRVPNIVELDAKTYSIKVPRDLRDIVFQPSEYVQHFQIGSGPRLFGKSIRSPRFDQDQIDVTIYRYQPTTLKVVVVDAEGMPVALKEESSSEGPSVRARYVRDDEVREAGGIFESSESLMARGILDGAIMHFVLPGEEIELTVTTSSGPAARRLTLRDGETRTVQVKLTSKLDWTESTKPTPRITIKP